MGKNLSIKPYVAAEAGYYNAPKAPHEFHKEMSVNSPETRTSGAVHVDSKTAGEKKLMPTVDLQAGVALKYNNNWFADASVRAGNNLKFEGKAGYAFDINKTFGLELSAQAQHTIVKGSKDTPETVKPISFENLKSEFLSKLNENSTNPLEEGIGGISRSSVCSKSNPVSETRYTAGAAVEYKPNKNISVKFGAQAGYRTYKSEMATNYAMESYDYLSTKEDGLKEAYYVRSNSNEAIEKQKASKDGFFMTPIVELNAQAKNGIYGKLQIDGTQLSAGIGYTIPYKKK